METSVTMSYGTTSASVDVPEVLESITNLQHLVEIHLKFLSDLQTRLDKICHYPSEPSNSESTPPNPIKCDLASTIDTTCKEVELASGKVCALLSALEI